MAHARARQQPARRAVSPRVHARPLLVLEVEGVDVVIVLVGQHARAAEDEHAALRHRCRRVRPTRRGRRASQRHHIPRARGEGEGLERVGERAVAAPAAKYDQLLRPRGAEERERVPLASQGRLARRLLHRPPPRLLIVPLEVVKARDLAAAAKHEEHVLRRVRPRRRRRAAARVRQLLRAAEGRICP